MRKLSVRAIGCFEDGERTQEDQRRRPVARLGRRPQPRRAGRRPRRGRLLQGVEEGGPPGEHRGKQRRRQAAQLKQAQAERQTIAGQPRDQAGQPVEARRVGAAHLQPAVVCADRGAKQVAFRQRLPERREHVLVVDLHGAPDRRIGQPVIGEKRRNGGGQQVARAADQQNK
jgi:hypothetical protein